MYRKGKGRNSMDPRSYRIHTQIDEENRRRRSEMIGRYKLDRLPLNLSKYERPASADSNMGRLRKSVTEELVTAAVRRGACTTYLNSHNNKSFTNVGSSVNKSGGTSNVCGIYDRADESSRNSSIVLNEGENVRNGDHGLRMENEVGSTASSTDNTPQKRSTVLSVYMKLCHKHVRQFYELLSAWVAGGSIGNTKLSSEETPSRDFNSPFPFAISWLRTVVGDLKELSNISEEGAQTILREQVARSMQSADQEGHACYDYDYDSLQESMISYLSLTFFSVSDALVGRKIGLMGFAEIPQSHTFLTQPAEVGYQNKPVTSSMCQVPKEEKNLETHEEMSFSSQRDQPQQAARKPRVASAPTYKQNPRPEAMIDMRIARLINRQGSASPLINASPRGGYKKCVIDNIGYRPQSPKGVTSNIIEGGEVRRSPRSEPPNGLNRSKAYQQKSRVDVRFLTDEELMKLRNSVLEKKKAAVDKSLEELRSSSGNDVYTPHGSKSYHSAANVSSVMREIAKPFYTLRPSYMHNTNARKCNGPRVPGSPRPQKYNRSITIPCGEEESKVISTIYPVQCLEYQMLHQEKLRNRSVSDNSGFGPNSSGVMTRMSSPILYDNPDASRRGSPGEEVQQ